MRGEKHVTRMADSRSDAGPFWRAHRNVEPVARLRPLRRVEHLQQAHADLLAALAEIAAKHGPLCGVAGPLRDALQGESALAGDGDGLRRQLAEGLRGGEKAL